jgi:hypothetical protein
MNGGTVMTGATEHPAFPAHGPGFPPALPATLPTPPVPVPPGLPPLGDPTPPTPRPPESPSTFPKPGELSPPPAADESAVAAGEALLAAGVLLRREVSLSLLCVPLPAEVSSFPGDHVVTDSGGLANGGHWRFQIKPTRQSRSEWRAIEASTHQVSEEVLRAMQIMSFVSSPGSFSNQITLNVGS